MIEPVVDQDERTGDERTGDERTDDDADATASAPVGGPSRFLRWLVLIAGLALVVRITYVLALLRPETFSGDPVYYHEQANLLADGRGFIEPFTFLMTGVARPTAYHPPLYPLTLAAGSLVGLDSWRAHQLVGCLLGTATVVVAGLLARRVAGPVVGLIAAGIAAVYPYLWINDGLVLSETLAALTTTGALLATYRVGQSPSLRNAIVLGGLCGLAALARGEAALLLPLVAVPMLLSRRALPMRQRLRYAGAVCLVALAVVAPWLIRNATVFEGTVFISSNHGTTFFLANCPSTYDSASFHYGSWDFFCPTHARPVDEGLASEEMMREGLDFVSAHLDDVPGVVAARLGRVWGVFRPGEQIRRDEVEGRSPGWSRVGSAMYYVMVPLAAAGAVHLRRRGVAVWPLLAPFVIVTVTAAAFYGTTRFRAIAEVPLVVLAVVGAVAAIGRLSAERQRGVLGRNIDGGPPQAVPSSPQRAQRAG